MALPRWNIAPVVAMAAVSLGWLCPVHGQFPQAPPAHYPHHALMPPGAIGSAQLQRGMPWVGYYQPVEFSGPPGTLFSMASAGRFEPPAPRVTAGLLQGQVYRLRVTNIPLREGQELYPTVEVIDRTFPPPHMAHRFPIPVVLSENDLEMALQGKFVTRVIYIEDPRNALPIAQVPGTQDWFDAKPGDDPLRVADALGRPVAIVRIGGRTPEDVSRPSMHFLFNCPMFQRLSKE